MSETMVTPEVLWAQRSSKTDPTKNFIYLTISVPDVPSSNMKLDLKPTGINFTGHSDTLKKTYHLEIEFYAEIDVDETKLHHTAKNVEIKLRKKELEEAYWPRLLKDSKKVHYLKTDFDKWVDEDDQNETGDDDFSNLGGMGGMPGMGGNDFSGIDFSKLGGGGGGMGSGDVEDDEDDDMPPLEGEEDDDVAGDTKDDDLPVDKKGDDAPVDKDDAAPADKKGDEPPAAAPESKPAASSSAVPPAAAASSETPAASDAKPAAAEDKEVVMSS